VKGDEVSSRAVLDAYTENVTTTYTFPREEMKGRLTGGLESKCTKKEFDFLHLHSGA
jgi:hypothetical protein